MHTYIDVAINALGQTISDKDFEIQRLKWEIEDLKKTNAEFAEKIHYLTVGKEGAGEKCSTRT